MPTQISALNKATVTAIDDLFLKRRTASGTDEKLTVQDFVDYLNDTATVDYTADAAKALTAEQARKRVIVITDSGGVLTTGQDLTGFVGGLFAIINKTAHPITCTVDGSGENVTVPGLVDGVPGRETIHCDGVDVLKATNTHKRARGVAKLREMTPVAGEYVDLLYHTAIGDGGHGRFRAVVGAAPGTYTDDNGITIVPTGGDGSAAFVREYSGEINVRWFGAQADWDGSTGTDDSAAFIAAINAGSHVYAPPGSYLVASATTMIFDGVSNKTVRGDRAKLIKGGANGVFNFKNSADIEVYGFEFDGNVAADESANGSFVLGTRSSSDYAYAVVFEYSNRCEVHDCYVHDFAWDGIVAYGNVDVGGATSTQSSAIRVYRNRVRNVRNTMIWLKAIDNFWVQDNIGTNEASFWQKGNFIFAVEWCRKGVISGNQGYYIGDNAVGIGEMLNHVSAAVNADISITGNHFNTTRYHAILIAQGKRIVCTSNTIERAGAKDNMTGTSGAVLTGAITILGGTDASVSHQVNRSITVSDNLIKQPYEIGIYAYDRDLTTYSDGSTDIVISGNVITDAGKLSLATRITSGGVLTQFPRPALIEGNRVYFCEGDGIRIFGDAIIKGNTVEAVTGFGIHAPSDTVFGNVKLRGAISENSAYNCKRSGVAVAGRTTVTLIGNSARLCGNDTAPGTEDVSTAYEYAGIGVYGINHVFLNGNHCDENGSSGFVFRLSGSSLNNVRGTNNFFSENGQVFTVANLRSGAYLEGSSGIPMQLTLINSSGYTGTTQQYPIRVVWPGTCTSVDEGFDTHPNPTTNANIKLTNNIP